MSRLWMISYDISDNHRRREVEKCLQRYGNHVQKSIFECLLYADQFVALRESLSELISMDEDSLRYYPLCAGCQKRIRWQGTGDAPDNADCYIF